MTPTLFWGLAIGGACSTALAAVLWSRSGAWTAEKGLVLLAGLALCELCGFAAFGYSWWRWGLGPSVVGLFAWHAALGGLAAFGSSGGGSP